MAPPAVASFLDLPERSEKPRERGLTHVIDRGLSVAEVDGLLEVAGAAVDIVKLGWGTALVSANLKAKLERYAAHGIPVVLGGTLTELAIRQGRVEGLIAWLRELGLRHVEVSDGTIALEAEVKSHLIRSLVANEFTVLSEVGSKDADFIMAPYVWVEQIERDLQAGAWKVIAEARESGTAGIYRADGEVRTGLIDEIVHAIDPDKLIFEAPRREQQVWLLQKFGTECNLGNIVPADVLSLETLRLGLRSDTVERFALGERRIDQARPAAEIAEPAGADRVRGAGARLPRRVCHHAAAQAHADGGAELQADADLLAGAGGAHQRRADLVQARERRTGHGHDPRLRRTRGRHARARSAGGEVQTVLAALERPRGGAARQGGRRRPGRHHDRDAAQHRRAGARGGISRAGAPARTASRGAFARGFTLVRP